MSIKIDARRVDCGLKNALIVNETYDCYLESTNFVYFPFNYAIRNGFERENYVERFSYAIRFRGALRPQQTAVVADARRILDAEHSVVIKSYPGFGKTVCALSIVCALKLKCLVLVNRTLIMTEWIKSIREFVDGDVSALPFDPQKTTRDEIETCDICICNAINVTKKHVNFWTSFDLLIVDEFHQMLTPKLIRSLLFIRPVKLIGLSATPFRYDEFNACVHFFFGRENIVGSELNRHHRVYVHYTKFVPIVRKLYPRAKYIDWNAVLASLASSEERNRLIVDIILNRFPADRTWMILVKRKDHAFALKAIFDKFDVHATTLLGSDKSFDESARILIGTTSKIGTGFNHKRIDSLLIAADVQNYFVQFLGRCMRTPDVKPIVVDLVDDFGPLKKHFTNHRRLEYVNSGGVLEELKF